MGCHRISFQDLLDLFPPQDLIDLGEREVELIANTLDRFVLQEPLGYIPAAGFFQQDRQFPGGLGKLPAVGLSCYETLKFL
jgi:hypothetical protein